MERFKGAVCGIDNCRSRNYYRESGLVYCSEGHRQPEGFSIGESEDVFGSQGRRTRKRAEEKEKVYQHYAGPQAFELYLQCYQLILWKQSYWLVHAKGFPSELEVIVRDLWALRLSHLKYRVDTSVEDDEFAASQTFSSQPPTETDTDTEPPALNKKGRRADSTPKLIDTLGLCYLGLLLLRLPVSIGDMYSWASSGDIVYYRAIKQLPFSVTQRLPPKYHEAFATTALLTLDYLQDAVLQLFVTYHKDLGMAIPPLNYPLMLFRYIKELALPLDMYPAVKQLSKMLSYTFDFSSITKRQTRVSALPEPQLISLLLVAVKLAYPFDDTARSPLTPTEPTALVIDWSAWADAHSAFSARHATAASGAALPNQGLHLTEADVSSLTDAQLDAYLDSYETHFVDAHAAQRGEQSALLHALFRMFPTGGRASERGGARAEALRERDAEREDAVLWRVKRVQGSLVVRRPVSEEEARARKEGVLRPGSRYKLYRKEADMPPHARVLFEAAAKLTGLSLGALIRAVFQTEMRLQKWASERRKQAQEVSSESTDGAEIGA